MKLQNFELKNQKIKKAFELKKQEYPEKFKEKLNLSWSNWGFGIEKLETSIKRLTDNHLEYIELHGNKYGDNLGYNVKEVIKILSDYGIKAGGICGMFSSENDLSSNSGISRQNAIDYLKRNIAFGAEIDIDYFLVVPGAVGRSSKYDDSELERSIETLSVIADLFLKNDIKAAIEPIRSAEVSFCHTFADAIQYITELNHPGIAHINGDIYHMQVEESHIGETILTAGSILTNLHMADSNRCALGNGSMDIDTIIMSLYLIDYNRKGCYVTPEPLGPGGDPYPAMFGKTDETLLDALVSQSASYFREREKILLET
jgi:D-psicose/D-tagatose/L-ribulose 3-epimerase